LLSRKAPVFRGFSHSLVLARITTASSLLRRVSWTCVELPELLLHATTEERTTHCPSPRCCSAIHHECCRPATREIGLQLRDPRNDRRTNSAWLASPQKRHNPTTCLVAGLCESWNVRQLSRLNCCLVYSFSSTFQ